VFGNYKNGCLKVAAPAENPPWHGEEQAFLKGLINGMRSGILATTRDGRLMMLNDIGAQILGLSEVPPIGTPIDEALSGQPSLVRLLRDSFTMISLRNRAELDLDSAEQGCRRIGFTLSMVSGPDEEPAGAAIFFKDLTQIEHKEEQERLKDRLAAVGQMAASLAHEIRNPLAAIEVSCTLLKRRMGPDEDGERLLNKITAEVGRLNRAITSSLEFVRPVSLKLDSADLAPMLDEAISVAFERRGGPGIEVFRQYGDSMPPMLMDRIQLRQVFENLILNAMEAVGEEGRITVEARLLQAPGAVTVPYQQAESSSKDPWHHFERFAVVRVTDTGPGVDDMNKDRIFFPFYTTKTKGSGVGLSMAKKIVNSHRGSIEIGRAPEGGAVFTVRLPVALSPMEE
jgi:signal transduction histidine kinase